MKRGPSNYGQVIHPRRARGDVQYVCMIDGNVH
jgi:hypothetical protein